MNEEFDTSETTPLTKNDSAESSAVVPPDSTKTSAAGTSAAAAADSPHSELSDGLSDEDDDVEGSCLRPVN